MKSWTCVLAVVVGVANLSLAAESKTRRPNIIVIVSDDNGYADVGYQGCKDIPTPNIDSLAKTGVRFSNGYVSCPVCSPTRAGLLTGRYQQRFGHEFNPGPPGLADPNFGLPLDQVTIADRLKAAGYKTGMVGKWHQGFSKDRHPLSRGFDEFFGFLGGAHQYLNPSASANDPILRDLKPVQEDEYLTDAFGREAVAFIDRHAKEPFFLYLPFNAVHGPLQATDKYLQRFANIADKQRRTHAAQLSAMDDNIGRVIEKVRSAGLEENTLIFFLSDNGGPTRSTTSDNAPLRGYKGDVLEGGVRVPFLVRWKGQLPEGKTYDQPVIALDIFPTAVAAAGGTLPEGRQLDGVNLLPYLTGKEKGTPHEALFWRYGGQAAIRKGDWKLIRIQEGRQVDEPGVGTPKVELYNLSKDISESKDLLSSEAEKAKELTAALDGWEKQLKKPAWRGRAEVLKAAKEGGAESKPAKAGKKAKREGKEGKAKGERKGKRGQQAEQ